MSGYRRVNYYELCRLCTSSEGNKMNIFRDEGRRRQLQSKIQICLPIQVLEEDSLPKIVCYECVKKLENFFEFREAVVSAETMLESYFTSLRFSEDFLKEGKVYVKSTEKRRSPTPEDEQVKPLDRISASPNASMATTEQPARHQQPVVINNVNASNIHIISEVQARVQQYKCAMQMQASGVASAVVEATAETHYSYQQQTSQEVSQQQQQSNQSQNQLNQQSNQVQHGQNSIQTTQNQIPNQNQMSQQQTQPEMNHNQQRQITQQSQPQITQQNLTQISQHQNHMTPQQNHLQRAQRIHQFQKLQREFVKQQAQVVQQDQQQTQVTQMPHQNNNIILKTESSAEPNQQVIQNVQSESQDGDPPNQNLPTYTTVQATPEILLSLGFKDASLAAQVTREDSKDFKEFIKVTPDDVISRTSIGQISEFLKIRTMPEASSLITVNPQSLSQYCGKTSATLNQLNNHNCSGSSLLADVKDVISKEENVQTNTNSPFNCDVCGKPFKRKEHLFQHRKLHTGERPFACTSCGKAFSRKEHLVRHSVSHTGQKMHECEMCGKSFSRKDNLHKHRKTHGVSGPYICETCGKSFVVKHYYTLHLASHAVSIDGIGSQDHLPYKCDQCHKAFSVKQHVNTHKLRHRSKNNANANNTSNSSNVQSNPTANNVTSSGNLNNGNAQPASVTSVVEIQSVIEGNEQNGSFNENQYHGNLQHFQ